LATVGAARFRPARIYGRAVRVLVQVPVVFRFN
jgi:outer membrane biosynthesis protein TonB